MKRRRRTEATLRQCLLKLVLRRDTRRGRIVRVLVSSRRLGRRETAAVVSLHISQCPGTRTDSYTYVRSLVSVRTYEQSQTLMSTAE